MADLTTVSDAEYAGYDMYTPFLEKFPSIADVKPEDWEDKVLTLPMSKVRGFLLPADISSAGQFISDRPQCKVRVCHYPS